MRPVGRAGRRTRTAAAWARLLAWLAAVVLAMGMGAGPLASPAHAHARLVQSDPPDGAVLEAAPKQVWLWFSEPVEAHFHPVQVYNDLGERVDAGNARVAPTDPRAVRVNLKPLGPGSYWVSYRVVSADGHVISGTLRFTVQPPAPPADSAGAGAGPGDRPPAEETPADRTPAGDETPADGEAPAGDGTPADGEAPAGDGTPAGARAGTGGGMAGPPAPGAEPDAEWPPLPVVFFQALALAAALLPAGLTAFQAVVWQPALRELPADVAVAAAPATRAVRRWTLAAFTLLVLAGAGAVTMHVMRLAGVGVAGALPLLGEALAVTRVGQVWFLRVALAALVYVLALLAVRSGRPAHWWLAAAAGGGLLFTFSLLGHAAAEPRGRAAALLADWLHLAAVAPWLGGLTHFACIVPRALAGWSPADRVRLLAGAVRRFSPLALGCVAVLAVSGTYTSLRHIPSLRGLVGTPYGWVLLAKLGLILPVLALGAVNHRRTAPALRALAATAGASAAAAAGPAARFRRLVAGELALLVLVLGTVGFLTQLPPARVSLLLRAGPFTAEQAAGDLQVGLRILPTRVGYNTAEVTLRDREGNPVEGAGVSLLVNMVDHDMGEQKPVVAPAGPGVYRSGQVVLGMHGEWSVTVVITREGAPETRAEFRVPVLEPYSY